MSRPSRRLRRCRTARTCLLTSPRHAAAGPAFRCQAYSRPGGDASPVWDETTGWPPGQDAGRVRVRDGRLPLLVVIGRTRSEGASAARMLPRVPRSQPPTRSMLLNLLMVSWCLTECSPLVLALNAASSWLASSCGVGNDESSDVSVKAMRKLPLSV